MSTAVIMFITSRRALALTHFNKPNACAIKGGGRGVGHHSIFSPTHPSHQNLGLVRARRIPAMMRVRISRVLMTVWCTHAFMSLQWFCMQLYPVHLPICRIARKTNMNREVVRMMSCASSGCLCVTDLCVYLPEGFLVCCVCGTRRSECKCDVSFWGTGVNPKAFAPVFFCRWGVQFPKAMSICDMLVAGCSALLGEYAA